MRSRLTTVGAFSVLAILHGTCKTKTDIFPMPMDIPPMISYVVFTAQN